MEFGLFSNGFRPHTTAAQTYDEDIAEIVLADQLGMSVAFISEHHGEPPYINAVDTIPVPELMMCKAAALTKTIKMGAAVKLLHLQHPTDIAIQAAVTDHMLHGRFIFGYGSGFRSTLFTDERGLGFEDRHERLNETLDFIIKAWSTDEPFDWNGKHWKAKNVVALPKPYSRPHMQMATATDSDSMLELIGTRGWIMLSAFLEPAANLKRKAEKYGKAAEAAGRKDWKKNIAASRLCYIANSEKEALEDLRDAVAYETSIQDKRGFLAMMRNVFKIDVPNDKRAVDALFESGFYLLGEPASVTKKIKKYYEDCGGFGTFLYACGKDWATHEKRERSMRRFMAEVAPELRPL